MSDERILEVVERQDKYYILGFINGIKANRDELLRENEELKKQLEELREQTIIDTLDLQTHEYQQQEFVKYLEDMLDDDNDIFSVIRVKDVLQKYKEIIGGNKDEK